MSVGNLGEELEGWHENSSTDNSFMTVGNLGEELEVWHDNSSTDGDSIPTEPIVVTISNA